MSTWFADSYFFFALLDEADEAHQDAVEILRSFDRLVTTPWVLTELADGLATPPHRATFVAFRRFLCAHDRVTVLPADQPLFDAGIALYEQRADKEWSLADCISFVAMERQGIREALTADHHFEQAGFVALLK